MSKRAILTTIIVPILLISGLIIFLINNRQEPAAELVLTQQQIHFENAPGMGRTCNTIPDSTKRRRTPTPHPKSSHGVQLCRNHSTGGNPTRYRRHVPDSHQPRTSARRRDFGNRHHLHRQSQDPDCPPNNYCHSETICDPHA